MNWPSPPQNATKGKKSVGEEVSPHQWAIYEAVIHVEPAKPASPSAAGAAMGRRKMVTFGSVVRKLSIFSWSSVRRAIMVSVGF